MMMHARVIESILCTLLWLRGTSSLLTGACTPPYGSCTGTTACSDSGLSGLHRVLFHCGDGSGLPKPAVQDSRASALL